MGPYRFHVSAPLFELASECLRLYSNSERRLAPFDELLWTLVSRDAAPGGRDAGSLCDHLAAMPSDGELELVYAGPASAIASLEDRRRVMSKVLARPLSPGDTLSILLFQFLVERHAAAAIAAIDPARLPKNRTAGKSAHTTNVVPIRADDLDV